MTGDTSVTPGRRRSWATRSSGTRPPGWVTTRSARPVMASMLRVKAPREACTEIRTPVKTAAPRAMPSTTASARQR